MRSATPAPCIAVAGLSARMLAQSAARSGLRVLALDAFGDRDTRAAAAQWTDIGGGAPLSIDGERLAEALARAAQAPGLIGLIGWIAGSGLEPFVARLRDAPGLPRFIGNPVAASAAVREPRRFFPLLDALAIPHPPVRFAPPAAPPGWLIKRAEGCGGTHIERAESVGDLHALAGFGEHDPSPAYFQRHMRGRPLSALFIAAHGTARVIGFAEQLVCAMGRLPFVHAGSIGPIDLAPAIAARVCAAIAALCAQTGLTGMHSCDFLLDGDTFALLEINTRPSATMALYETAAPRTWPRGLLAWHIEACLHGRLPPATVACAAPHARGRAGQRVLFASHAFDVSPAFSDACLRDLRCRDVPMPGTHIEAGQPVCTLLVRAPSVQAVRRALDAQQTRVLQRIEPSPAYPTRQKTEPDHDRLSCNA
ncbi:ATP-grasp domain-containing protein [Paraburkholderia unamae]|uniref:ATP-grasp domain-containing protein n=1 Tax=Paraburkholderia unamae TaxID=219649 RepID=UPI001CAE253D|nr:ATP-grasp domain-containing protein [Paraburkholderia unamae]CAG9254261.1 ATP-grasp domain-containing protein [Paraburkholderia unamae]